MSDILAINGSYRSGGVTDQVVLTMTKALRDAGVSVETILLREYPLEFCLNCRHCTQLPGVAPGRCVLDDAMGDLLGRIESSRGYILASPTNFGGVTALFKRFMERLIVYAYWPREMSAPRYRKAGAVKKKAALVSSCAAPAILGRFSFHTRQELKAAAKTIGAVPVGMIFTGLVGGDPHPELSKRVKARAARLAAKLV